MRQRLLPTGLGRQKYSAPNWNQHARVHGYGVKWRLGYRIANYHAPALRVRTRDAEFVTSAPPQIHGTMTDSIGQP
jgi:hypothetical protein